MATALNFEPYHARVIVAAQKSQREATPRDTRGSEPWPSTNQRYPYECQKQVSNFMHVIGTTALLNGVLQLNLKGLNSTQTRTSPSQSSGNSCVAKRDKQTNQCEGWVWMTPTGPGKDDPFYEDRRDFEVRFGQTGEDCTKHESFEGRCD